MIQECLASGKVSVSVEVGLEYDARIPTYCTDAVILWDACLLSVLTSTLKVLLPCQVHPSLSWPVSLQTKWLKQNLELIILLVGVSSKKESYSSRCVGSESVAVES